MTGASARLPATALLAVAAALAWAPGDAGAQAAEPPAPGAPVGGPPATVAEIEARCLDLTRPEPPAAPLGRLAGAECRVEAAGPLVAAGSPSWRWALYRHALALEADEETPEDVRGLLPDTLPEEELVVFAGPDEGRGRFRPVWHHRVDGTTEVLQPPEAVVLEGGALMIHDVCVTGTGGCLDHAYLLREDGAVEPLEPAYRAELAGRLPEEWGTWKGIWLEPESGAVGERAVPAEGEFEEARADTAGPAAAPPPARVDPPPMRADTAVSPPPGRAVAGLLGMAGVYLPGDANCCPSFGATFRLRRHDGSLHLDSLVIVPDPGGFAWEVEPDRFGHVTEETGEAELRESYGGSVVAGGPVRVAGDRCVPGARVFPGREWEFEVAFADPDRTRPAFARASHPEGGPWRTMGRPEGDEPRVDWTEPPPGAACEPTEAR